MVMKGFSTGVHGDPDVIPPFFKLHEDMIQISHTRPQEEIPLAGPLLPSHLKHTTNPSQGSNTSSHS
jgi:hypothetical protein